MERSRLLEFIPNSVILCSIRAGTIFRLGSWGAKESNSNITLCNNYVFFEICTAYYGVWGKPPEAGEFSIIFVLKVTLQSPRLLLTVSYRKKIGGTECITCFPNNFVVRAAAPLSLRFARLYDSMPRRVKADVGWLWIGFNRSDPCLSRSSSGSPPASWCTFYCSSEGSSMIHLRVGTGHVKRR